MSSALTQLVPVFTGDKFQEWTTMMESYLMAQGQWYVVSDDAPREPDAASSDEDRANMASWRDANIKALGNLRLRLAPSINVQIKEKVTAKAVWDYLQETYGKPGVAAIYTEFKAALDLTISMSENP